MQRTPYSVAPYGVDNYRTIVGPSELFTKEGFIFVYQDVRGRYLSEGTFVDVPAAQTAPDGPNETDESTDTYDTIDWLVKNVPNNNGKVGIWGISYPGFFAAYQPDQFPSGAEGRLAASAHGRCRQRRRRISQRRVLSGREFRLLYELQAARTGAGSGPQRGCALSISAPRTNTISTCAWVRCRTPTSNI